MVRTAKICLKRKDVELFKGNMSSLKRFKDDVKEVTSGYECGISIEGYSDIQEGDIIECFELKETKAILGEFLSSIENGSCGFLGEKICQRLEKKEYLKP